jgi:fused signal recognition particle receptor
MWLKLKSALSKTSDKISSGITSIFSKKKLDQTSLDELEDLLISSDMGHKSAQEIIANLSKGRFDKEITDEEIKEIIAKYIAEKLTPLAKPIALNHSLEVILFCGVNGNGKTTTIGKMAAAYVKAGHKVMIAACDTFRAAAVAQLSTWADRANCSLFEGHDQQDPAAVAHQAYIKAKAENFDILLIDTAGRLQNQHNLMQELSKITRVVKKLDALAPHHVILVLDATVGQNALQQVEVFSTMIGVSGLIITKLDGTAKAGVVLALAHKHHLPIHAIGVGEGVEDLREFVAADFAENLVGM